ncbi:hypothetical protein HPP92_012466 [Vanilla planifolia]|uniref:Uncharacterized protein n=1 Tax=Vanilla planifolia TaxID=51239 RepID=A0A835R1L7_VANPL|nr:hypothetical protein HPP92_012466 [Vanilla planifolia]
MKGSRRSSTIRRKGRRRGAKRLSNLEGARQQKREGWMRERRRDGDERAIRGQPQQKWIPFEQLKDAN